MHNVHRNTCFTPLTVTHTYILVYTLCQYLFVCLLYHYLAHYCGRHRFGLFVDVRVGVAFLRNKFALRARLRNLNLRSHFSIFDSFRDIRVQIYDF